MHQSTVSNSEPRSSGMGAGMLAGIAIAAIILGLVLWYLLPTAASGGTGTEGTIPLQSVLPSIVATAN